MSKKSIVILLVLLMCVCSTMCGKADIDEDKENEKIEETADTSKEHITEWVFLKGDVSAVHEKGIYKDVSGKNFDLSSKSRDSYALYIKVFLENEAAVEAMKFSHIEVCNTGMDDGEISWYLRGSEGEEIVDQLKVGVNEIELPFSTAGDRSAPGKPAFDITKPITYFRIYNINAEGISGVTLQEVKIIDTTLMSKENND